MEQHLVVDDSDTIVNVVLYDEGGVWDLPAGQRHFAYAGVAGIGWQWSGDIAINPNPVGDVSGQCRATPLGLGALKGTIFDFDAAGDVLPLHTHGEHDVHISIVARGSFACWGDRGDITVSAGDVIDWNPGEHHGFRALEPRSRLVNVIKAHA